MKHVWPCRIVLGAMLVVPAGCVLLDVIAQQELFDARYLLLTRSGGGLSQYSFSIDYGVGGCRPFSLTEGELIDMLDTGAIPGTQLTGFVPEMLEPCENEGTLRYEANQLADITRDSNGDVISIERPRNALTEIVNVDFSSGGVMSVLVFGMSLNGNTVSRTATPDTLEFLTAVVPAGLVGASGSDFRSSAIASSLAEGEITAVAQNPNRFALKFLFAAKQDRADDRILLLWSRDIVLRTDI